MPKAMPDKLWQVEVRFKCRVKRNAQGFKDYITWEELLRGEAACPMEERIERICSTSPADNIAGREAAKRFPERCPVCGKFPHWDDFDIL